MVILYLRDDSGRSFFALIGFGVSATEIKKKRSAFLFLLILTMQVQMERAYEKVAGTPCNMRHVLKAREGHLNTSIQ